MEARAKPISPRSRSQRFFSAPTASPAQELFKLVLVADYKNIKESVTVEPHLMFATVEYSDAAGKVETLSALQYAFKTYDSYLWKILLGIAQQNVEWLHQFNQQLTQQTDHIDLEPLFEAYAQYASHYFYWRANQRDNPHMIKPSFDIMRASWLEIGLCQFTYLPVHMLKEFCRIDNGPYCDHWHPKASFDSDVVPQPLAGEIYNVQSQKEFNFLSGQRGTLFRLSSHLLCSSTIAPVHYEAVEIDVKTLRKLYETRKVDLQQLRQAQLLPTLRAT